MPTFWGKVLKKMGLESDDGINKIRKVLDFMGYKTPNAVAKLLNQKNRDRFEIEVAKNAQFLSKFGDLTLCHGDFLVLQEIASAAAQLTSFEIEDITDVQNKTFERCNKVNEILSK